MAQLNKNALDLLEKRYYLRDLETGVVIEHSPEEMFRRVAHYVAGAEKTKELQEYWEERFYNAMNDQLFIPNTPTLINAGKNKCLSACSVIGCYPDSLEGIYEYLWRAAKLTKYGCGVGQSLSTIRPKGEIIKSSGGTSAGVVNWMKSIQTMAETTIQGDQARRAANMVGLRFNHPDIYDFIDSKLGNNDFSTMNISVVITNEEFEKALNRENIWLEWNGKKYREVNAGEILDKIVDNAWKDGEPGLIFIDKINNANPFNLHDGNFNEDNEHYIDITNPCLHKDSYLVTINGLEKVSELKSPIWNGETYTQSTSWNTGIKKVIKLMTKSGFEYIVTPDHKFMLKDGTWEEAYNLIGKDIKFEIKEKEWNGINPYPDINYKVLGFELGDGSYHTASNRMKYINVTPDKDKEVQNIIEEEFNDKFYTDSSNKLEIIIPYGTVYANAFNNKIEYRIIPDWIMQLPKNEMRDFLQGLFSANGCNLKKYHKIQLVSINKEMLQQVQQMLLLFGIKSKLWYHNKQQDVEFRNGTYTCKQSCHLVLSRDSYVKFLNNIGFIQSYKNGYDVTYKVKNDLNYETVILIQELEDVEVWDFSEPILHQGITNGAYVHNCGEQPLEENEFCTLGSINVEKLYDIEKHHINYALLDEVIETAERFLDNIVDVNEFVFPEFEKKMRGNRKIGLGILGFAHLLIKLGIRYDSQECLEFIDVFNKYIDEKSQEINTKLAEEKGYFPNWKDSIFAKNNILRRNATTTTQAPTGSTTTIAGSVCYGIEPLFNIGYIRRIVNEEIFEINELFTSMLHEIVKDEAKEKEIIRECVDKGTPDLPIVPKKLRELFRCANDVSAEWHVKILAQLQKYYDNAVSKTINMHENATKEDVRNAYELAYKLGCKGITIYRNNSRSNQTIQIGNKKENGIVEFPRGVIEEVPKDLIYRKFKLKTGCGVLYFFVGVDDEGKIYDCFCNTDGVSGCVVNTQAVSRLVSANLRGGVPIEYIITQLDKAGVCPSFQYKRGAGEKLSPGKSCASAIANVLKGIIKEFDEPEKEEKIEIKQKQAIKHQQQDGKNICPSCGASMFKIEGCVSCSCGFSKCN